MEVIQHDVRRLDRLITDISDASRLDAELARADAEAVDVARLLEAVVSVANERRHEGDPLIRLNVESRGSEGLLRDKTAEVLALLAGVGAVPADH